MKNDDGIVGSIKQVHKYLFVIEGFDRADRGARGSNTQVTGHLDPNQE